MARAGDGGNLQEDMIMPHDDDPCEAYQYDVLPTSTSVRLLKLHSRSVQGKLEISLKVVDLADNPTYHALSYTWGNPHSTGVDFNEYFNKVAGEYSAERQIPIICEGNILYVQQNLHDALCQLPQDVWTRRGLASDADEYMWIDAICINQQDIGERSAQVQIMHLIYRQASYTVTWFGRADEYTEDAMRTISRIAKYPREAFANSEITPYRNQGRQVYEKSNLQYTSWMEWRALAAFLKKQWFSRLWVVQECVLSRELVLCCGKHEISWDELCTAARNIQARCEVYGSQPSTIFMAYDEFAVALETNLLQLKNWRDNQTEAGYPATNRFTFESLVYDTWTFRSTDPRDKIYGLFGLMPPSVTSTWRVDYESPVEECFAEATRRIIRQADSLMILSCVQGASHREIHIYPSWVPDYSVPYVNMMCNLFAASGKHDKAQILPSPRWDRLRLHAALFDEIVETANERNNYVNSMMLLEPSWFELAMLLKQPYVTGQPRTEVLWRTLCADQDANFNSPAPARFGQLFHEFVSAMVMVRADLEAEEVATGNAPPECAASFSAALDYVRRFWADNHLDILTADELLAQFSQRPRFMSNPEQGWLIFTLFKLQILASAEESPCTPDLVSLEKFHQNPTYVMREKRGSGGQLLQPEDGGFFNSFRLRYGRRKLFYTGSGYLGLGPASTQVGDVVCILPGAGGPFVFRYHSGMDAPDMRDEEGAWKDGIARLQLVGECYVHGIMHGEATEMEEFELKEIEIV